MWDISVDCLSWVYSNERKKRKLVLIDDSPDEKEKEIAEYYTVCTDLVQS